MSRPLAVSVQPEAEIEPEGDLTVIFGPTGVRFRFSIRPNANGRPWIVEIPLTWEQWRHVVQHVGERPT